MHEIEHLKTHAERIRASGVLGRSRFALKLFDYLVDCSMSGRAPKEIEVAVDVFGKDGSFDVSQDALVRVYIHKLRRKLDEYYAGPGAGEGVRLVVPKGMYRFVMQGVPAAKKEASTQAPRARPSRWPGGALVGALAISLFFNIVAAGMFFSGRGPSASPPDRYAAVRSNPLWSRLLADDKRIFVVLGDYYIFGERDEQSLEVGRLVREFSINSRKDLERAQRLDPELEARYLDLDLAYLPTSSAHALRAVMPILATAGDRVRIATVSEVSPAVLKSAHVIYIGYLSGLGMLHDVVFAGSSFAVGETYDELIHRSTHRRFVSQAGSPWREDARYYDYGFFSTFAGPTDNQIVIVAGTRDIAVMHVAESLTGSKSVDELVHEAGNAPAFEALYEVYGMDGTNIDGKLVLTSTLDPAGSWAGSAASTAAASPSPLSAP